VLLAARVRATRVDAELDLFALLRAEPVRELPTCVVEALDALDERRFSRASRQAVPAP
jgi:hypothetical protein